MMQTEHQGSEKLIANWDDLYRRKFHNLALFELQIAADREPTNPVAWFLLGQTQLALHRTDAARVAFDKARETAGKAGATASMSRYAAAVPEALRMVDLILTDGALPVAPEEPFEWLTNSAAIAHAETTSIWQAAPALEAPPPPIQESQSVRAYEPNATQVVVEPLGPAYQTGIAQEAFAPNPAQAAALVQIETVREKAVTAVAGAGSAWEIWEKKLLERIETGEVQDALRQVDSALSRHGDSIWLSEWRARILEKIGNVKLAAEQYVEAARIAAQQGATTQANDLARKATAVAQGNGDALAAVGSGLLAAGVGKEGGDSLRAAVRNYTQQGETAKIISVLKQIAHNEPGNKTVAAELARLTQKPAAQQASRTSAPSLPKLPAIKINDRRSGAGANEANQQLEKIAPGVAVMALISLVTGLGGIGIIPLVMFMISGRMIKSPSVTNGNKAALALLQVARVIIFIAMVLGFAMKPYPF
ncbi:hypothetical protein BH09SUM1_BH09SUM1_01440 [soil metagenome]